MCSLLIGTVIISYPFYYNYIIESYTFSFQKIFAETTTNETWLENEEINMTATMSTTIPTSTTVQTTNNVKTKKFPEMIIIGEAKCGKH